MCEAVAVIMQSPVDFVPKRAEFACAGFRASSGEIRNHERDTAPARDPDAEAIGARNPCNRES